MNSIQQTLSHYWVQTRKTFRLLRRNKSGLIGLTMLVIGSLKSPALRANRRR